MEGSVFCKSNAIICDKEYFLVPNFVHIMFFLLLIFIVNNNKVALKTRNQEREGVMFILQ
jgi:hypothetical protein